MQEIADHRGEIYDYFQANAGCQKYFFDPAHEEEYVAYYNSMYLLQDSTESLLWHRKAGFSSNPFRAYLEFWGVMQAVVIQQDSIAEIFWVITKKVLDLKILKSWSAVRELRNICAGHPAKKDRPRSSPLTRSFMGQTFGDYNSLTYEQWEQGRGTTHPTIKLGALLDAYAIEGETKLVEVLAAMQRRWP